MVTHAIADNVAQRRRGPGRPRNDERPTTNMHLDLLEAITPELATAGRVRFPSPVYASDPVGFCRNILGFEPWSKQREILEAVRDNPRVAIVSGQKVGKSTTAAVIALWKFCSFRDARVIMTSTTARQVDQILWRELRMQRARSGRCVACKAADPDGHLIPTPCEHSAIIDGELGDLARTGLKSHDFREVVGFTARESEAIAGISGSNLTFIVDEASGVPELIFEALLGNMAGGASIVMFGNGTRNEGEFFAAFHSKQKFYFTMSVSSESTPNVIEQRIVIPGLATYAYVEDKKHEWGENSPQYIIRIKGGFALGEDSKIFSTHVIMEAEKRWFAAPEAGRLYIGLDPAGETGLGDDTAASVRRGLKQLALRRDRGLNDDQHLVFLLQLIEEFSLPRETPVIVLDAEGSIGAKLAGKLRAYLEKPEYAHAPPFELVTLKASGKAVRRSDIYDRLRDELAANLQQWFREGGAIVTDTKLAQELHQPQWKQAVNGRFKVTPKDELRKLLGRSPDAMDSLQLAAWEPRSLVEPAADADTSKPALAPHMPANDNGRAEHYYATERQLDPFGGNIDPYS